MKKVGEIQAEIDRLYRELKAEASKPQPNKNTLSELSDRVSTLELEREWVLL